MRKVLPAIIILAALLFSCTGKYAVKINDTYIRYDQLNFELDAVFADYPALSSRDKQTLAVRFIESLALEEAASQEAARTGVEISAGELDAYIEWLSEPLPDGQLPLSRIWGWPDNQKVLRQQVKKRMLLEKLLDEQVKNRIEINPEQIKDFYDSHHEKFIKDESVKIQQIFFDQNTAQNMREAEACYNLLVKGCSFSELAQKYSDNYDLGWLTRGLMDSAFDKTAFSLSPGQYSVPFVSSFGIHILYAEDRIKKGLMSREKAEPEIREFLTEMQFYDDKNIYLKKLKEKTDILYDRRLLDNLELQ